MSLDQFTPQERKDAVEKYLLQEILGVEASLLKRTFKVFATPVFLVYNEKNELVSQSTPHGIEDLELSLKLDHAAQKGGRANG